MQKRKCAACWKRATRKVFDEGDLEPGEVLYLCPECPSPSQIQERADAIRASWGEQEREKRHYRKPIAWDVPGWFYEPPQLQRKMAVDSVADVDQDVLDQFQDLLEEKTAEGTFAHTLAQIARKCGISHRHASGLVRRLAAELYLTERGGA